MEERNRKRWLELMRLKRKSLGRIWDDKDMSPGLNSESDSIELSSLTLGMIEHLMDENERLWNRVHELERSNTSFTYAPKPKVGDIKYTTSNSTQLDPQAFKTKMQQLVDAISEKETFGTASLERGSALDALKGK
jgi:hypothetical protein